MTDTIIGRNEPCPCGSGKKYKRCCGVGAEPILNKPKAPAAPSGLPGGGQMPPGMDPSAFDPQWVAQVSQAFSKLPKAHMQKLQGLLQKAMAGKDVAAEAATLERILPPEFQQLLQSGPMAAAMAGQAGGAAPTETSSEMSEDQARLIVEQAVSKGQLSKEQAENLLNRPVEAQEPIKPESKFSKLWKGLSGKK